MELIDVDTRHAYDRIREMIVTLELPPATLIDEQRIAEALRIGQAPVRDAIKLLAHEGLVSVTPRHGIYVADINISDLDRICEVRLALEPLCAELAAQRATDDDMAVLNALRKEQEAAASGDGRSLRDMDHKFHRAIVTASKNQHLARIMERLFGLAQRLWTLALPRLDILPAAVAEHLKLVDSIKNRDPERARKLMNDHVKGFHEQVRTVLEKMP